MPPFQPIEIKPFESRYQQGIDEMLDAIAAEYAEPFYHHPYQKIEELALLPGRYYWVALSGEAVAGTAGVFIGDGYAVLKSLFVAGRFRGRELRLADKLVQTATDKARQYNCRYMYLGTMAQFKAAQRFYEKNGYQLLEKNQLPPGYPVNNIDTVFYGKEII
jgi:GNAT superfamily N-acetyltransferase